MLVGLALITGAAILVGGIFFLLEGDINTKIYSMKGRGGKLLEAFIVGVLFVTRGPIRFYEFKTMAARTLAGVLAIGSTLLIAGITAVLASALTVENLRSEISGLEDLNDVRVGALKASTSSKFLDNTGIAHRSYDDLQELLSALDAGHLDAAVSDAAFLKYAISKAKELGRFESLSVLPNQFEKQNYGFALKEGTTILEDVNQALLSVRKTPEWKLEVVKYLGE